MNYFIIRGVWLPVIKSYKRWLSCIFIIIEAFNTTLYNNCRQLLVVSFLCQPIKTNNLRLTCLFVIILQRLRKQVDL